MPIYLLFGIAVLESRELQMPKVRTVEKQEFAHLNSLTLEIERIDLAAEIVGRIGSRILFRAVAFEGRVFAPRFEMFGFRYAISTD